MPFRGETEGFAKRHGLAGDEGEEGWAVGPDMEGTAGADAPEDVRGAALLPLLCVVQVRVCALRAASYHTPAPPIHMRTLTLTPIHMPIDMGTVPHTACGFGSTEGRGDLRDEEDGPAAGLGGDRRCGQQPPLHRQHPLREM